VLVVDDDEEHCAAIRELIEDEGLAVIQAQDGKEALEFLLDRSNPQPCLIILDLSMPVMTGWELLAILRCYVRFADIPVVLISGHDPMLDPVKHGVIVAFLRKPYDRDELLALVAKHRGAGAPGKK
jgi:CheY-like chemotaxis protein